MMELYQTIIKREGLLSMKSVTEILGDSQMLSLTGCMENSVREQRKKVLDLL